MGKVSYTFVAVVGCIIGGHAVAAERTVQLAAAGSWVAFGYAESAVAPVSICVAASTQGGIAFRAASDGLELRAQNAEWSLPARVTGNIAVTISGKSYEFAVTDNKTTMVIADIDAPEMEDMFARMDKAASMTVQIGKAPPFPVSLTGSTRVTNAFRTCAGLSGNAPIPGANPFR